MEKNDARVGTCGSGWWLNFVKLFNWQNSECVQHQLDKIMKDQFRRWLTNSSAETETAAHNRSMAWPSKLSSHHYPAINHQWSIINYQLSKLSSHQHPAINYQLSIISHHFIINLSFRVFSVALLPPKIWEYQYKGKLWHFISNCSMVLTIIAFFQGVRDLTSRFPCCVLLALSWNTAGGGNCI